MLRKTDFGQHPYAQFFGIEGLPFTSCQNVFIFFCSNLCIALLDELTRMILLHKATKIACFLRKNKIMQCLMKK
jgi:hypothetical protein